MTELGQSTVVPFIVVILDFTRPLPSFRSDLACCEQKRRSRFPSRLLAIGPILAPYCFDTRCRQRVSRCDGISDTLNEE